MSIDFKGGTGRENPTVSIITPSFNRASLVRETAESIFSQTYSNWEWVIVDDGSTDNSWEILKEFSAADTRVRIFQRDRMPKGACTCRNIAVENATGEYLIFLDTDDLLAPWCLKQRVDAAKQDPEYDFLIFPMLLFRKKSDDMGLLWNIDNDQDDLHRILVGDPVCQGTGTLWKRESFIKAGKWKEDLNLWQDVELHIRTILQGRTFKKRLDLLPDIYIRVSDISLSRTSYHSLPKLHSRISVLKETVLTMAAQNKLEQYGEGLKFMAGTVLLSAINSGYLKEARDVQKFCFHYRIFRKTENGFFSNYLRAKQFKLLKVPYINRVMSARIKSVIPDQKSHLGIVPYKQPLVNSQT